MPIQHLPATATAAQITEALRRDGAAIVDELVAPAVMDAAYGELEAQLEATSTGVDEFSGSNTRRCGALVARSATCRDLVMHPLALATAEGLLADSTNIQLHLTQIIAIGPGSEAQMIHRDQWAFDFFPFPQGFEAQCNTIWAMSEFTEENGATRVVPGSNKLEDKLRLKAEDTEPAEMKKGSVLFYTGSVYHGGGANRSDATRYAINITYNRAWLRQEENQYLSVPADIARELPKNLLRLMGYARGAYALGYIDDLRDPIAALRPDLADEGFGELKEAEAQLRENT
jgi:ectoine hydroxylase-related dioxygenase (phytanoyl-CoA dioxygenase family)